jgi:nephrocystin-3
METSNPLIISGEPGCGRSTLIAKWIDMQQRMNSKDPTLLIYHFSKRNYNDTSYHPTLFKILNKIREAFGIKQQLEFAEEKLRTVTQRWLDSLQDRILESDLPYKKVILIVDEVDKYLDA